MERKPEATLTRRRVISGAIGGDGFEYTLVCIVLHPGCIARGRRTRFHFSGIRREEKEFFRRLDSICQRSTADCW